MKLGNPVGGVGRKSPVVGIRLFTSNHTAVHRIQTGTTVVPVSQVVNQIAAKRISSVHHVVPGKEGREVEVSSPSQYQLPSVRRHRSVGRSGRRYGSTAPPAMFNKGVR